MSWFTLTLLFFAFWYFQSKISKPERENEFKDREISNLWNALGKVSGKQATQNDKNSLDKGA